MDKVHIVAYSGGKDSTATLVHLVKVLGIIPLAVFSDTGNESKITLDYIGYISDLLVSWGGQPVIRLKGEYDYLSLAIKKGRFPSMKGRFCTQWLKIVPFLRWLEDQLFSENCIILTGIRRDESKARSTREEHEEKNIYGRPQWNPIVSWTAEDAFNIHKKYNVEINPLYKKGAKRVGCWPCCNAGRNELLLIEKLDPDRIDEIRDWEKQVNGTYFFPRKYSKVTFEPILWGIDKHIAWANRSITGQMNLGDILQDNSACAYAGLGICE